MAREFSRTQRVADHLQRELAALVQHEVRDPRVGMVSITGVDVSRDLGHARVYYTELSRDSKMRSVPQLKFQFDASVGRGRELENLIRRAADADRELGLREDESGEN
jgi:ribosome-binding factor A